MNAGENTQPPGDPRGLHGSTTQAVGALERAVDVLKVQHDGIAASNTELRTDMKDVRDRMARLEVKVDVLPSKVWIGSVVVGGMTFFGAIVAIIGTIIHFWK